MGDGREEEALLAGRRIVVRAGRLESALRELVRRGEDPDLAHGALGAWVMSGAALADARAALGGEDA